MASDAKPRPLPIPTTQPFWDGLAAHRVLLQRCGACGSWVYYPRARCTSCLSDELAWTEVSGRGRVHTFTIGRQATHPAFVDDVPQLIAVIELEEGVHMTSTLLDVAPQDISVGLEVEPVFDDGDDGITLLRFRPRR
jgi:uncharacterized protein